MIYQGSINGFTCLEFHKACNYRGATISLFKLKNGLCIGGFTKAQWKSVENVNVNDPNAFLFSVTDKKWYRCKSAYSAIFNDKNTGPNFGIEELLAEEPFDGL